MRPAGLEALTTVLALGWLAEPVPTLPRRRQWRDPNPLPKWKRPNPQRYFGGRAARRMHRRNHMDAVRAEKRAGRKA